MSPRLPGLGWFNHVVVYMPGNPPLWIDPTAHEVAFGELPTADQGRWALVAAPGTKDLVKTPRSDYHLTSVAETDEYVLSETGQDRVNISFTYGGAFAQGQRMFYSVLGREKMTEYWKNMAQNLYSSKTLGRLEYSSVQDKAKPFEVRVELAAPASARRPGRDCCLSQSRHVVQPPAAGVDSPGWQPDEAAAGKPAPGSAGKSGENTTAAKERKSPLVLRLPHVSQMRYRITPPPGYTAGELPKDQSKQCGPLTIEQHFQILKDGAVEATFRLDTGPGAFTAAEVNALRQALADLGGGNVTSGGFLSPSSIGPENTLPRAASRNRLPSAARLLATVAESCGTPRVLCPGAAGGRLWRGGSARGPAGSGTRPEVRRRPDRVGLDPQPRLARPAIRRAWTGPARGLLSQGAGDRAAGSRVRAAYATLLEFSPDGLPLRSRSQA